MDTLNPNDNAAAKIYDQVNENWRFLAKWRQLAFAGHLAVLAGALSFINSANEHTYPRVVIGTCLLLFSAFGIIFWIADRRTHTLTMHACQAGVDLENGTRGFFTVNAALDQATGVDHSRRWTDSHSRAADFLFLGSTIAFFVAGVYVLCASWGPHTSAWDYTIVHEAVEGTVDTSPGFLDEELRKAVAGGWEFVSLGNDSHGRSLIVLKRHKR